MNSKNWRKQMFEQRRNQNIVLSSTKDEDSNSTKNQKTMKRLHLKISENN